MLQLLPVAMELAARPATVADAEAAAEHPPRPGLRQEAVLLVSRCMGVWSQCARMSESYLAVLGEGAAAGSGGQQMTEVAQELWALHARSCRLVHYAILAYWRAQGPKDIQRSQEELNLKCPRQERKSGILPPFSLSCQASSRGSSYPQNITPGRTTH